MKLRKYNEAFEEGHLYDKEGNDVGKFQKAWHEEVERKLKEIINRQLLEEKEIKSYCYFFIISINS